MVIVFRQNQGNSEAIKESNQGNEEEAAAAKQRENLSIEERTKMFKAMLLEKEVQIYQI